MVMTKAVSPLLVKRLELEFDFQRDGMLTRKIQTPIYAHRNAIFTTHSDRKVKEIAKMKM